MIKHEPNEVNAVIVGAGPIGLLNAGNFKTNLKWVFNNHISCGKFC